MSDDFKRKLEAYEKGELNESELEALEKELDKLEEYQEFLQENDPQEQVNASTLSINKKQKKMLRHGKWKARFQTALVAIGIFIVFTIFSTIFTGIYYSWGSPDRVDVFRNIIDNTLTITNPYGNRGGTSTSSTSYFGLQATRNLNKVVGHDQIEVGELKMNFLFSWMTIPEEQNYGRINHDQPMFALPGSGVTGEGDWNQLENLPEGTVVSAYVSFSTLLETQEVFDFFDGRNMDLLWFPVTTGIENEYPFDGIILDPIGFPSSPIWLDDDFIVTERTEENSGWFGGKIVSETAESPEYEEGDYQVLHNQFMKTLTFLEQHENKVNNIVWGRLNLSEIIDYLNENGFQHYGAVITGPTKEILQLQEEDTIALLEIDEVGFWNWEEL